jgi:integrase/recombinase XerD
MRAIGSANEKVSVASLRLHEKGGKTHEMPCHHTLDGYLAEYIERARLAEVGNPACAAARAMTTAHTLRDVGRRP